MSKRKSPSHLFRSSSVQVLLTRGGVCVACSEMTPGRTPQQDIRVSFYFLEGDFIQTAKVSFVT